MKVLIICPYFPPDKTVAALRMGSLARYLWNNGDIIHVLTNPKQQEIEKGCKYHFVNKIGKGGKELYREAFNHLTEKIAFDVVIISGGPFYTFELAVDAQKRKIPCILDYRDPWTFDFRGLSDILSPKKIVKRITSIPAERRAIKAATKVVTVTDGWVKDFQRLYPTEKEKFTLIQNGYDDDILGRISNDNGYISKNNSVNLSAGKEEKRIRIVAFGKLFYYSKYYSKIFIRSIGKRKDVIVEQIGEKEKNADELIKCCHKKIETIHSTGFMNYDQGIQRIQNGDLCVIIDNRKNALGTKIYDYVYLNKPILYVGPSKTALARLINTFENGYVCSSTEQVNNVLDNLKMMECMELDRNIATLRNRYSRSIQNKKWYDLIHNLAV